MQGTQVWSLDQEDPTYHGETKPVCCNYWPRAPETENQLGACAPQWEAPHGNKQQLRLATTRQSVHSHEDPTQPNLK